MRGMKKELTVYSLLDISDIFSELVDNNTLVRNIAQNYVQDGKVYGMAISSKMGYVSNRMDWKIYEACAKDVNGVYQSVNDTFIPNDIVGINKASKDMDLSKDFVKSLYEEETQEKHINDGFPMNAKVLEQWMTEEEDEDSFFCHI